MIKPGIFTLLVGSLMFQFVPSGSAHASGGWNWNWNCETEAVTDFWEGTFTGNRVAGRGTVCATSAGLWSTLSVQGLTAGNAYTVWWVYIDDPASCAGTPLPVPDVIPVPEPVGYAGQCGLADFFTPDVNDMGETFLNPLVVFGRMDSVVADRRKHTRFAGDLRSFSPSAGSQVWMFVFGHGPADASDKRQLARQLLTPEDPTSGTPHVGIQGRFYGYPAAVAVFDMP